MRQHSPEYHGYMKSKAWAERRHAVMVRAGGLCEHCQRQTATAVHHITYDSLGEEPLTDLQALCARCHRVADAERTAEAAEDSIDRRVDAYASKKYGSHWQDRSDAEQIEERILRKFAED
jgi:5-methylcytosine-specific restriction endonuclease McrA